MDAGAPSEAWAPVFEDLDAPVLSVWGTDAEHAFFVGERGLVIERAGERWQRHRVPTDESLWWVWGSALDDVYAGGEGGTLLHFDGEAWRPVPVGLDRQETVWGIFGIGERRFVVGGRPRTNGPGFLMVLQGGEWRRVNTHQQNLYKVWGRNARELYVVGGDSSLFAWRDAELVELDLGPAGANPDPLFTVAGNATTTIAVGGVTEGLVFEAAGEGFSALPFVSGGLNGVSVSEGGSAVVVGLFGAIRERRDESWLERDRFPERHYHAALAFDDGAYAVGGDLLGSGDDRRGLIVARGEARARSPQLRNPSVPPPDAGALPDAGDRFDGGMDASMPASDAGDAASGQAGVEAGAPIEAGTEGRPDGGPPGAGEICGDDLVCAPDLECWFIQGLGELRCVPLCEATTDCGPEFGPQPQCAPPGCQTTLEVCLRAEWQGCFLSSGMGVP